MTGASYFGLTEQVTQLDAASAATPAYPYWHQRTFSERNPFPTVVKAAIATARPMSAIGG